MQFYDLKNLIASTGDAAFAADGDGNIVVINSGATELLGVDEQVAVGMSCNNLLCGEDACGHQCSPECSVRQAVAGNRRVRNYDLRINTPSGRRWCNISVLQAAIAGSTRPYTIHILRGIDTQKRLELLMMEFIVRESDPSDEAMTRSPVRETGLSARELEILRLLAAGESTAQISHKLSISRTTVSNHIQHILKKLNVHTRLEAIRLAERSRLI